MMRIDLTCPVEAWKVTLPTEENPQCDVRLFNLSSLQVVSVEVTLLLSSRDGEETAKITHRGRGLNGAPGKPFHMQVPVEGHIVPEQYEITVDKVWYDNASVWRREKENMISYEPNNLRRSAQLTTLRSIAGEMASGYPVQQEGLWVCVCGRPNLDDTLVCARCHREKAEVFARFSQEAIDQVVAAREAELTVHGRETLRQTSRKFADEKDFVRRKGRYAWVVKLLAALAVVAVVVFLGVEFLLPHVRYEMAMKAYEAGEYDSAATDFAELGDYKDAETWAKHARLYEEHRLLGSVDTLAEEDWRAHTETLNALGDYETIIGVDVVNPEKLRQEADWKYAEHLFQEGLYADAERLYQKLGEAYEAPARLTEIAYIRACAMLEAEQWDAAREAFAALGDYKDSAELHLDTWYTPAVQAAENGNEDEALALFAMTPGHRDADTQARKIHYDRAVILRDAGKLNEAAEEFYLARGYEDAEEQANECFYVPADVAYETMDYEKAAELFAKISGYRDADEKWRDATIQAARAAIQQIDYKKARELLTLLPQEDEEVVSLVKDCTYYPAVNAYVRGDYEEAIGLFAQVPGHRDADEQAMKCRYDWAGALFEAGQYAQAETIYTALGDYSDAASRLLAIRYAQAGEALAAANEAGVDKAIALYTELGEYSDSADKVKIATFRKAELLLEKGDHAAARDLFAVLGDFPGAAEKLIDCDYAAAKALAEAGKTEEALAAFEALGEYADSQEKVELLRYEAALALAHTDPAAAAEALENMGSYGDAAIQALALRYQLAESMIETDRAGAVEAFRALADYADAADRADQLCYEDAQALLEEDRAAGIAALETLGDYADAADLAAEMRYEDAVALADAGDWEAAAAAFDLIADYEDSADRANQLRYDAAMAFADQGRWEQAEAAFAAMSGEVDADEQVNMLRYAAAENLLKAGKTETAAAAFEAIGSYSDARDRAMQIRYDAAAELAKTDWEAGAAAFDKIAGYEDSAEQANALRYNAAAQMAAAGDWQSAADMYAELGDYSDSAEKVYQVRYNAAAQMAAARQWDEAVALYTELGDYADCKERVTLTRYTQAQTAEKDGDYLEAARCYAAMGTYKDCAAKATEMYDKYYADPAAAMANATKNKNWAEVIHIMSWLDMSAAPQKYQYLTGLYQEACYEEGNRLFQADKPYEAYVYYKQLPANFRQLSEKLQKAAYLILGTWEDVKGNRYIFREEGICNLSGETMYFNVIDGGVHTGETVDGLALTHRITGLNQKNAYLIDMRGEDEITIYLTKVQE